jgi:UDP-N-acetylglucosamine 4-epimerase
MQAMESGRISKKRILVTGGAGFIGSSLCESLLESENYVICLDNFSTGKKSNIDQYLQNRNFRLIEGDIRDFSTCQKATDGCDLVFHQAALGSVPRSISDPVSTADVNIGGFVKILFASVQTGVKRFIYAASSSTYGDSQELPKVEDKIGKPLSPYGVTKLANEHFGYVFSNVYDIEIIGLRYFNVFGRRQDPDGEYAAVIPRFIKLLKNRQRPVINGDGSFSRDFTHIENVILANNLAAVAEKEACGEVFNIACGERTTLLQLFNLLKENLSSYDNAIASIEPEFGPSRSGDIPHSLASVEKASRLLHYNPAVSVKEGIARSVEWYWNNL